jgi:phage-related protein
MMTGDFKGGMFGTQFDDLPIVDFFLSIREAVLGFVERVTPLFDELGTFFNRMMGKIDLGKMLQVGQTLLAMTNPIGQVSLILKAMGVNFGQILGSVIDGLTTFFATLNEGGDVFDGLKAVFGDSSLWATLESALNGIVAFVQGTVLPGLDKLRAWFMDTALPAVIDFLEGTVIPGVQKFFDFLAGVWADVSPGLMALGNWFINDVLPLVVKTIETVVIPAVELFIGVVSDIWRRVSPYLLEFWNWFTAEGLPAITKFLEESVIPLIGDVIGILKDLWEDVSPFLFDLFDWFMKSGLPLIRDFLEKVLFPILERAINFLKDLWEAVQPGLTQLYDWFVTTALPAIIDFLTNTWTPLMEDIINLLATIWTAIEPGVTQFHDKVVEIFGWIMDNGVQPLIDLIESIAGVITGAVEDVRSGIQKAEDFIKDPLGAVFGGTGATLQTEGMTDAQIQHQIRMIQDPQYAISPQAAAFAAQMAEGVQMSNQMGAGSLPEGGLSQGGGGNTYVNVEVPLEVLRNEPGLAANGDVLGNNIRETIRRRG